jgi:hypothetical protein
MGMFDNVRCEYPLPVDGANEFLFQTKDTPAQYLDDYEIRADGTLWYEEYDARIEETEDAPLGFWMHRENRRWTPLDFTGELEIHHYECESPFGTYYSFRFWFRDGVVKDLIPHVESPTVAT